MELEQRIKRMEQRIATMAQKSNRPVWAKVSWVTKLTGWTGSELRQARIDGLIEFRQTGSDRTLEYRLDSIPEIFLIKNKSTTTA